jgi:hypothetical protein
MASSFTTSFGIEKIATGEQAGVWGTTTNHNADILDRIASYTSVALSGTTHTLTVREASPGAGTENLQDGMYRVIKFTGALGANNTVTIAPNTSKAWFIVENATTDSGSSGPYSVILTQGSGANITLQNGKNAIVYCDGAGSGAVVYNALNDLQIATLEVTGAAAVDGLLTAGASVAVTGNVTTTGTVEPAGDTSASDNAAIGYDSGEGLVLTGQGSTNDVTIKNDADGEVMGVLTGTTTAAFTGQVTATGFTGTLDGILGSGTAAAISGTTIGATGKVTAAAKLDMNGTEIILDADADTSITADTDDQIDIKIAGADDFQFTANTFTAAASSVVALDDGAVATPALTNTGDLNTGIYFPAADTVGMVTGGTEQFRFGSNPIPGGNKNLVLNPAMQIAQRGTSFTSYGATANEYSLDNWKISVGGSASARWTVSQESSGGVNGRSKWLKALNTTADTPGAAEGQAISAPLEGNSIQALRRTGGGTKASTLSADVIVHADGGSSLSFPVTIAVALIINDGGNDRQIVTDISITSADTWQTIEFNAPADTSGNGPKNDNTRSGNVVFTLASGSNFNITADTWENNTNIPLNTSSTENLADATNNYIGFTNVQWEVGDVATDFAHEDIGTTLQKCQRYFRNTVSANDIAFVNLRLNTTTQSVGVVDLGAPMRTAPTLTISDVSHFQVGANGAVDEVSAFTINNASEQYVEYLIYTAASWTAGSAAQAETKSASATVYLSAEL